jgi:hypothetical protein
MQYKAGDAVSHNRAAYTSLKDHRGVEPSSGVDTWKVLAKAPPTTPKIELDRLRSRLVSLGYVDLEREALEFLLQPGEIVNAFDAWSITTDRRVLTREGLRSLLRPLSWANVNTWLAQFPPLPKRPEETGSQPSLGAALAKNDFVMPLPARASRSYSRCKGGLST